MSIKWIFNLFVSLFLLVIVELISGKSPTKKKSKKEFFASDSDSEDTISSQTDSSLSSEFSLSLNGDKIKQKVHKIELQILVL